ncbi:MAG: hypothetical protein H7837_06025 [Magnetococcus sp. MYC-9]
MTVSDAGYHAVGIHDTAEGRCGIALLWVRKRVDDDCTYLSDPQVGLQSPCGAAEWEDRLQERELCSLANPVPVTAQDQAFYIGPVLQQAYRDLTGIPVASGTIGIVQAAEGGTLVGIASRPALVAWRCELAEHMLANIDKKIVAELACGRDDETFESLLKKIEQWGRNGALCAGDTSQRLYWEFMVRVGAALSVRPDQQSRLHFTYERMVKVYFPSVHFRGFFEQAEAQFRSWKGRSDIVMRPPMPATHPGSTLSDGARLFNACLVGSEGPEQTYAGAWQR